jgi:hypothetical protein
MSDFQKIRADLEDDPSLARLHPAAERLVPDSALWDLAEDYAPIGNDTGADVFQAYRAFRAGESARKRGEFFQELLAAWELPVRGAPARTGAPLAEQLAKDYYPVLTWDDAVIGWVIAQLLVDGGADPTDAEYALVAIERQRTREVLDFRKWANEGTRLDYLRRVEAVIRQAREQAESAAE